MIMSPHLILAFLLIEGSLAGDGLAIVVDLIGGQHVIGGVGAQFEVMRL
jgi:hypothetical protein